MTSLEYAHDDYSRGIFYLANTNSDIMCHVRNSTIRNLQSMKESIEKYQKINVKHTNYTVITIHKMTEISKSSHEPLAKCNERLREFLRNCK